MITSLAQVCGEPHEDGIEQVGRDVLHLARAMLSGHQPCFRGIRETGDRQRYIELVMPQRLRARLIDDDDRMRSLQLPEDVQVEGGVVVAIRDEDGRGVRHAHETLSHRDAVIRNRTAVEYIAGVQPGAQVRQLQPVVDDLVPRAQPIAVARVAGLG